MCALHNWKERTGQIKVIDAVIFSVELDLLEIRLKELWPHVDHFIVLEADKTFTGRPKALHLKENLNRFAWAAQKLVYRSYDGLDELKPDESPFKNENQMRIYMDSIISKYARTGDLVICSDVDEIPTKQTVALLKQCDGFPNNLHLELHTYLYSFEYFFSTDDSWRAHISKYDSKFNYKHSRLSDDLLADSGMDCLLLFLLLCAKLELGETSFIIYWYFCGFVLYRLALHLLLQIHIGFCIQNDFIFTQRPSYA